MARPAVIADQIKGHDLLTKVERETLIYAARKGRELLYRRTIHNAAKSIFHWTVFVVDRDGEDFVVYTTYSAGKCIAVMEYYSSLLQERKVAA